MCQTGEFGHNNFMLRLAQTTKTNPAGQSTVMTGYATGEIPPVPLNVLCELLDTKSHSSKTPLLELIGLIDAPAWCVRLGAKFVNRSHLTGPSLLAAQKTALGNIRSSDIEVLSLASDLVAVMFGLAPASVSASVAGLSDDDAVILEASWVALKAVALTIAALKVTTVGNLIQMLTVTKPGVAT